LSELQLQKQRYALCIEYDGSAYNGWQIQPHAPSIQQCLNSAISMVADEHIECTGAGRTDTGVHAAGQIVHFDSSAQRTLRSWLLGINSNLPPDIAVLWVCPVGQSFHARFSALARSYRYVILNRPVRSALERHRAWWVHPALNLEYMQKAATYLIGEHDFSAFRASSCQAHSAVRNMTELCVARSGQQITVSCSANAFLHHMVRNIVGSLVRVGKAEERPEWMKAVLESGDRRVSGMTAPAAGLTLMQVDYPPDSFTLQLFSGNELRER